MNQNNVYLICGGLIIFGLILTFICKKPKVGNKKTSDNDPNNDKKWDDNQVHTEGDF
jgi:hypothetical protein